jgi:hypothetical protein
MRQALDIAVQSEFQFSRERLVGDDDEMMW